ncbi:hypothetical protein R1sor_000251 [Riccia sorocarpa]|uniref:Uncharacterized protein n=1 Tax=Riccia sorocarpa TaxID=122646 RepID=A0ABD3GV30_9MARC
MGRNTSDTNMYSDDDSSTSNSESDHRRRRRKDKAKRKKRRSRQKKDVSTDSCSSSSDPDFDIRSSSSNDSDSEDRRRRHRTTSKRKKKRRPQKQSFDSDSSSSSDPDLDIKSRRHRSKWKCKENRNHKKKHFSTDSSYSRDRRDAESSDNNNGSSTDQEVSSRVAALAQEVAELQRQLAAEKEITSTSQETEEELYWLFVPETAVERAEMSDTQSSEEEESSWSSEEEVYYKRKCAPACSNRSDSEEEVRCNLQVEESESDVEVVEENTQSQTLLRIEPREDIAEELSSEEKSESEKIQPLVEDANDETEVESFTSEAVNEWLSEEKSNFSSQVNDDYTSTTSELGESIVDISILFDAEVNAAEEKCRWAQRGDNRLGKKLLYNGTTTEKKWEAEVSFAPRLANREGRIDTFIFKGVTWNLWRAMRAHGRKVFGLLQFMEELGLFFHRAVVSRVHLTLEEEFLASRMRNRLFRLGYHGGYAANREEGVAKVQIPNLSHRKHGSVACTIEDVEAYRLTFELTLGVRLKVWVFDSQEETTSSQVFLLPGKVFPLCMRSAQWIEGEVILSQTSTRRPSTRGGWRTERAVACGGEHDTLVGSTIIAKGYCLKC